ncbi:DUF2637 domain-containing protein [Rhodococcus sp. NPDC003318]|uniref:DUF2637 domain-containing protein n=1 Tax=Rhodococcus sp. NPDC003318 TaxID=3364503 RepID=UPI003673C57D
MTTDIDPAVPQLPPGLIKWSLRVAAALTIVIGTVSFISSFTVLADLARDFGWPAGKEWHFPVIVDGTITATMLAVLALSQHTDKETVRRRRFVRALQYFAVAASVGGNAFHAYQTQDDTWRSWTAAAIASIAPIFLLAMTETVKTLALAPRNVQPAPVQPETPQATVHWWQLRRRWQSRTVRPHAPAPEQHQPETPQTIPTALAPAPAPADTTPAQDWDQAAAAELEPVAAETIAPAPATTTTTETPSHAALFAHPTDPESEPDPELLREFLNSDAKLEHVVRATAELKLEHPDATWEALGEAVGGVRHSTAMRRWDKFIKAARDAGYVRTGVLT